MTYTPMRMLSLDIFGRINAMNNKSTDPILTSWPISFFPYVAIIIIFACNFGLIIVQMDFYFGNANLRRDRFMKKEMESAADGCK